MKKMWVLLAVLLGLGLAACSTPDTNKTKGVSSGQEASSTWNKGSFGQATWK